MRVRVCAAAVLLSVAMAGCGASTAPTTDGNANGNANANADGNTDGSGNGNGVEGSCAFLLRFRGRTYLGRRAVVIPQAGPVVGEGVVPPCLDTGDAASAEEQRVEVTTVEGVDPDIAVAQRDDPEIVYVRSDLDRLPPVLARLFTVPACDPDLAPIRLQGTWLGILGADGHTELDMVPPYDVEVLVTRSSPPGYERADLTVRVPPALGQPLTRADVQASLWTGGEIDVTATCVGTRFLATGVFIPVVNSAQS
jgi:hypothetical protein